MENNETPGFDEKSKKSLLLNVAPQAAKPQISVFFDLIEQIYGNTLRKNEMTGKPERFDEIAGAWVEWNDVDDARLAEYIQSNYGLYSPKMLEKDLQNDLEQGTCCPVKTNACVECETEEHGDQRHNVTHGVHRCCCRICL